MLIYWLYLILTLLQYCINFNNVDCNWTSPIVDTTPKINRSRKDVSFKEDGRVVIDSSKSNIDSSINLQDSFTILEDDNYSASLPLRKTETPSDSSSSLGLYNSNVEGNKSSDSSLYKGFSRKGDSNKREYHTSRTLSVYKNINTYKKDGELNTKYLVNTLSPSYNAINDILLNRELSNFEKQKRIEGILREFWKIELYNLIGNKRSVELNNIGLRIIARQLKSLDEDLSTLLKKTSFSSHKSYAKVIKEIDSSLILSVVMGKIIPFVVKYSDLEKQPVTNLMWSTGEAILREVALELYKRDLKSGHISS